MPPQRRPIARGYARKSAPSTMNLSQQPRELERNRTAFDFEDTFDVVVGKAASDAKRFSMHSSVVIGRSETLAALLRAELNNEKKLVTLENQDPELFQEYVHCLYFGPQALRQWAQASVVKTEGNPVGNTRDEKQAAADLVFEQLIGLYTLAANLVDFKTANMVVGEIVRTSDFLGRIPAQRPLSLAYASTTRGSPLRSLLRDFWIYQAALTETDTERLRTADFPAECVQDIAIEMLRIGQRDSDDFDQAFKEVCVFNMCRYHQHDKLHAACVAEEQDADSDM